MTAAAAPVALPFCKLMHVATISAGRGQATYLQDEAAFMTKGTLTGQVATNVQGVELTFNSLKDERHNTYLLEGLLTIYNIN